MFKKPDEFLLLTGVLLLVISSSVTLFLSLPDNPTMVDRFIPYLPTWLFIFAGIWYKTRKNKNKKDD